MVSHEAFNTMVDPRPLSQAQMPRLPFVSGSPPPPPPKPSNHNTSGQDTHRIPPSPLAGGVFHRPPPPPPDILADTPRPLPPTPSTYSHPSHQPQSDSSHDTIPPSLPLRLPSPFLPEFVPSKSTADLTPILSDPALLSALASTHPSHAESVAPSNQALDTNLALASQVLALQNHVTSLREQTQQLLLQHTTLSTQWKRKQAEMDQALEPWSPKAMYGRLVSGISEQEAIVKAIEESFLDATGIEDYARDAIGEKAGEREVGEWIKRIRDGVTVSERRRESRARWDEGRVGGWR